jgi:hypothetical protein
MWCFPGNQEKLAMMELSQGLKYYLLQTHTYNMQGWTTMLHPQEQECYHSHRLLRPH